MNTLKKKLLRMKKIKFLRNIIIGVVSLILVALVINIASGYKRDKFENVINLIVNDENKTEELKNEIYVSENGTIYIAKEDIGTLFDNTIYYDNKYNQIITTSDTKVANMIMDEKQMTVNNSNVDILDSIIEMNDTIYLPISEMKMVYNIDIKYVKETNRVIIDKLNKGMIKAIISDDTAIKFKPRELSKNIGNLIEGETVYCFYTTSKGWRQIRTQDGILGYVKANKLTSEYILRQDMLEKQEAQIISMYNYKNNRIDINKGDKVDKIDIKTTYTIKDNNIEYNQNSEKKEEYKNWVVISNKLLEEQTDTILEDYKSRTNIINLIVNKIMANDINGVIIDFNGIKNKENMIRFIIELAPKLREIGISTSIVLNENIEKNDYINIADYIIE